MTADAITIELGLLPAQEVRNRIAQRERELALLKKVLPLSERAERELGPDAPVVKVRQCH